MSLESVLMWRLTCDRCHEGVSDDDYWAYTDESSCFEIAADCNWLITDDGRHYCPECTTWDEEGDERVPRAVSPDPRNPKL